MNKATWLLMVFLIAIVFVSGCTNSSEQSTTSNLYENSVYGFTIEHSQNWDVKENIAAGGFTAIVAFMGPIKDNFQTNINIKTENAQGYTLNQYITASKQTLSQAFAANDYLFVDEGALTIDNQNAYFVEYAVNLQGQPLKIKQVVLMNGDNAFIITYTAAQSAYDDSVNDFGNSVSTFKFTSSTGSSQLNTGTQGTQSNSGDVWSKTSGYTVNDCYTVCNSIYDIQAQVTICQGDCDLIGKEGPPLDTLVNELKAKK